MRTPVKVVLQVVKCCNNDMIPDIHVINYNLEFVQFHTNWHKQKDVNKKWITNAVKDLIYLKLVERYVNLI